MGIGGAIIIMAFIIGAAVISSIVYVTQFAVSPTSQTTTVISPSAPTGSQAPGYAAAFSVSGLNPVTGALVALNAELFTDEDSQTVAETSVASALTSLGTNFANTYKGYVMIGNDLEQSTTDRGDEFYYTKQPVEWTNVAGLQTKERIPVYLEGTPTWTGKDEGTVEATTNISVSTAESDTTLSLKIQVSANAYLGNPDPLLDAFSKNKLAVGFNESTGGLLDPALTRPTVGTKSLGFIPGNYTSFRMLGLWVLTDVTHLDDDPSTAQPATYEFGVTTKAAAGQDPAQTDNMYVSLWDLTWCRNDARVWVACWSDESAVAADGDAGLRTWLNEKTVFFT